MLLPSQIGMDCGMLLPSSVAGDMALKRWQGEGILTTFYSGYCSPLVAG